MTLPIPAPPTLLPLPAGATGQTPLNISPADEQDRAHVGQLAAEVQAATEACVELAFVDQRYTGANEAEAAAEQGIRLEVVKPLEARCGFVRLPRRWVVERSFACTGRFRRLARDFERLPQTLAGLHVLAFVSVLLRRLVGLDS